MSSKLMQRARVNGAELEFEVTGAGEPVAADPRCLHRRGVRAALRRAGREQPLPPGALPSARLRRQQPGQSAVQSCRAGRRLPRPAAAPRHRARTRRRPFLRRGHRPAAGARRAGGRPLPRPARTGAAQRPKRSPAHRSARDRGWSSTVPATRRARPTASFAGRSGQTTEPGSIGSSRARSSRRLPTPTLSSASSFRPCRSGSSRGRTPGGSPTPVFGVLGAESASIWPGWNEVQERLREWLPQTEPFVLAGANHALQERDPRGIAEAIAPFLARHAMPVPA